MMIPKYVMKRDVISKSILQCNYFDYYKYATEGYYLRGATQIRPNIIDFASDMLESHDRMLELLMKDEFSPGKKIKDRRKIHGRSVKKNCIFNTERNVDISFDVSREKIKENI